MLDDEDRIVNRADLVIGEGVELDGPRVVEQHVLILLHIPAGTPGHAAHDRLAAVNAGGRHHHFPHRGALPGVKGFLRTRQEDGVFLFDQAKSYRLDVVADQAAYGFFPEDGVNDALQVAAQLDALGIAAPQGDDPQREQGERPGVQSDNRCFVGHVASRPVEPVGAQAGPRFSSAPCSGPRVVLPSV